VDANLHGMKDWIWVLTEGSQRYKEKEKTRIGLVKEEQGGRKADL